MKRNTRSLVGVLLVFAFATLACKISLPDSDTVNNAATSVAGTVAALAETAGVGITPAAEITATLSIPTLEPLPVEYPLRVAFASPEGDLYTWAEDMAAPIQLLSTGDVCCSYVSPDGSMIAYTRYADDYSIISLEVINSDGSDQRVLLDSAGFAGLPRPASSIGSEPYQVAWVPGSHILAMNTRLLFEGPGLAVGENLYLFDLDTGTMSSILSMDESWKFRYSPDGTKIAVSYPTGIDIYDSNGVKTVDTVLSYEFVNTASEYAWVAWPSWSLDSSMLVADVPPVEPFPYGSGALDDTTIWRMTADGMSGELVYGTPMNYNTSNSVSFSEDLNKILYFTRAGDTTATLHLSNIDGSGLVDYATGNFAGSPVWSPDNEHFYYATGEGLDNTPYIGEVDAAPTAIADYNNADTVKWIDENHYIVSTNNNWHWRLLYGTIGSPTGLIFESPVDIDYAPLTFSINR